MPANVIGDGNITSPAGANDWPNFVYTTQTWVNGTNPLPDSNTRVDAEFQNDVARAIKNLGSILGVNTQGSFATVVARLDAAVYSGTAGLSSYAVGDLLYASTTTTLARLADVAVGSYLRSGGVSTAPTWSTATLPNTATTGDLLYASAANVYSNLADVAVGSYLRSGGLNTAPVWSTLTLPNAATTGDLLVATGTNALGVVADVAVNQVLASGGVGAVPAWTGSPTVASLTTTGNLTVGSQLLVSGVGPHAIGGGTDPNVQIRQLGSFTGSAGTVGYKQESTLNGIVGGNIQGMYITPTLVEAASGTHAVLVGLDIFPLVTPGLANTTDFYTVRISGPTVASGTTTATGLSVAAPTGATSNYAAVFTGGNVGFGVTGPMYKLDIQNSGGFTGIQIYNTASNNNAEMRFKNTAVEARVGASIAVNGSLFEVYDQTNAASRLLINTTGNVKIAGFNNRATTEGTNHLDIFDGTAPVGTLANGISLYSTLGELRVMDSAGNPTLLSPHGKDGYWIFESRSGLTKRLFRVDMEKMIRALNQKFGWDFVHEEVRN